MVANLSLFLTYSFVIRAAIRVDLRMLSCVKNILSAAQAMVCSVLGWYRGPC